MPILTSPPEAPSRTDARATGLGWAPRILLAILAGGLVASSLFLPLWRAKLVAPQYPQGLHLIAYGDRVAGDVDEISSLNHYVGMRAFNPADAPEMALWPLAVAGAMLAVAIATLVHRTLLHRLALAYLWLMPFGVLADIQFRLYQYGHDIEETAAFRIPEFTPWVIGPTAVLNFTTWAWPGLGLLALLAAAAVVTFGPAAARLVHARLGSGAVSAVMAAAVLGLFATPAAAQENHDLTDLLDGLPPGAELTLEPGTYRGNLVIDTPVHIVGVGRPTIVGDGSGSTITIRAPGTVVSGIEVHGSGHGPLEDPAAIRIEADDVRITDTVISHAYIGIAVSGGDRVHLANNTIMGRAEGAISGEAHAVGHRDLTSEGRMPRGDGIWLWNVDGALLRNNHITHTRDGIFVSYGTHALLDGNRVTHSRYAVHSMFARELVLAENTFERNRSGAVLMYGGPALLLRNTVLDHRSGATGFGVLIKDIADAELVENIVARNRVGLHLESVTGAPPPGRDAGHLDHAADRASAADPLGAELTRVHANTVALNTVGVVLSPTTPGRFSGNSFVDNTVQAVPKGEGVSNAEWTDAGWGNYWSTYQGYESAVAGRGAASHVEGSRIDSAIQRMPTLVALAGSPAFRILRAAERRLGLQRPILVDHLPLTTQLSPSLPEAATDPVTAQAQALRFAGLILVAGSGLLLLRARRRRRPPTPGSAALRRDSEMSPPAHQVGTFGPMA